MPTKPTPKKRTIKPADPARMTNQRILAERTERIANSLPDPLDLGLNLQTKKPENAAEFLRDAWDKKAFGEQQATITRTLYGPDPLLDQAPEMRASLEKYGIHDYAEATRKLILQRGHLASPNPVLARGLKSAISQFGKEKVAQAFADRILQIPVRTVEIDASDVADPLIMGSNILRDAVARYEEPGFAYKFLGESCMKTLGLRGYEIVKDSNGDPVRAGTLILGRIPEGVAIARRQKWAGDSQAEVDEIEAAYEETINRTLTKEDRAIGLGPIRPGTELEAFASEKAENIGETRTAGVRIERQERIERRLDD